MGRGNGVANNSLIRRRRSTNDMEHFLVNEIAKVQNWIAQIEDRLLKGFERLDDRLKMYELKQQLAILTQRLQNLKG